MGITVATPFGSANVLGLLVFAGIFLTLTALAIAFFANDPNQKRARARVQKIRLHAAEAAGEEQVAQLRRSFQDSGIPGLDKLLKRIVPPPAQLRQKLARTGKRITLGEYLLTNLLVAAVVGSIVYYFFGAPLLLALLVGFTAGIGIPYFIIGRMAANRLTNFLKHFPDAIDLIVRGLKSGLPASESITLVGQEIPDPVGVEFRRITDTMKLGQPLEVALNEAAARVPVNDFKFFVISLSVQKETGGNLTETLENLSNLLRRRHQMKLKIRAMSSEARASAYIIGMLPFVIGGIIYFLNPDYTTQLFVDPRGKVMVGVGLAWLGIGAFVMAKMVKFEI